MSPALIQLFAFMTSTFLLGLFLGWALWRYGGVSKAAMDALEAKIDFLKKSFEQSRAEVWNLQDGLDRQPDEIDHPSRPKTRRRRSVSVQSRDAVPTKPVQAAGN